jgi:ribosome assembly protein RRB1
MAKKRARTKAADDVDLADSKRSVEAKPVSRREDADMSDEENNLSGSEDDIVDDNAVAPSQQQKLAVFRPGVDVLEENEVLDYDPGAYELYQKVETEWPCLSIDIIKDDLGVNRKQYPLTSYVVGGTQAEDGVQNQIYVMKWSKLYKTEENFSDSEDESSDEEEDEGPILEHRAIAHPCAINRIRAMPQGKICAAWGEDSNVYVWNIQKEFDSLDNPAKAAVPDFKPEPLFVYKGHKEEGYGMAWNPHVVGRFLSGDNSGAIRLWNPVESGWNIASDALLAHKGSIEDIEWKQIGVGCQDCFASCSSDGTVRVWDVRENKESLKIDAHNCDVNVLAWNPLVDGLIATGADDGCFKVFDIRNVKAGPMADFQAGKGPITSISWHPTDETAIAVGCADNTLTLWDLAVEEDDDEEVEELENVDDFPAQMLFLHQGQTDIKECKWHPQIPGLVVSTAGDGLNVFKPCKRCNF